MVVDDIVHAMLLTGMDEGEIVFNRQTGANMVFISGKWKTVGEVKTVSDRLQGYVFCLTGKMWTTREKIEQQIRNEGGMIARSLSRKAILVQGEISGQGGATPVTGSKKQQDAKANGSLVVGARGLLDVLNGEKTAEEVFGLSGKPKKKRLPAIKVTPIDREQHNAAVKRVFEDIEAIAFRK